MLTKPETCRGCPLYAEGAGFSRVDGEGTSGVMLIGEALGQQEAMVGLPFQGQAGGMLNKVLYMIQLKRADTWISNIIKCRPPRNWLRGAPWEFSAIEHCRQYLEQEISSLKPSVLVPMGDIALREIVGLEGILDSSHPKRGYVYPVHIGKKRLFAIPTVHPAYVMRGNHNLTGVLVNDILKALDVAKNGAPHYQPRYVEHPSLDNFEHFYERARQAKWLVVDIETSWSVGLSEEELSDDHGSITRVSFSIAPEEAITITEWDWILEILQVPVEFVVFWNASFDVPRLKAQGAEIRGRILDAMWMWHYLKSDLPKSLAFVTPFFAPLPEWKSKGRAFPEFYSCCDADATAWCFRGIWEWLRKENRLGSYLEHEYPVWEIISELGSRGVPIDLEAKREFSRKIEQQIEDLHGQLQTLVPDDVKPRTSRKVIRVSVECPRCRGFGLEPDRQELKQRKLNQIKLQFLEDPPRELFSKERCRRCKGTGWTVKNLPAEPGPAREGWTPAQIGSRWVWQRIEPFLPNSPQHVLNYIQSQNHRAAKHHKTEKLTTEEGALRKLAKRHKRDRVYPLLLQIRKLQKLKSQYLDGYDPDEDGLLKTRFTLKPSTGRLASEKPNVQNIRKHGDDIISTEMLREYRRIFRAPEGFVIYARDYSAIEAVLTGWYARDPNYIRAAKLGIHGIFASYILVEQGEWKEPISLGWSEEDIRRAVKEIKSKYPQVYQQAKTGGHGSNYLASPRKLREEHPDAFPSMQFARGVQEVYFYTLGKNIRTWQRDVLMQAHTRKYLETAFGFRREFWDVLRRMGKLGDQAKEAVAFLPQSTAADIIKRAILNLSVQAPDTFRHLRWPIHDELLFLLPEGEWKTHDEVIKSAMELPVSELEGLVIETEAKIGPNWGQMEDV